MITKLAASIYNHPADSIIGATSAAGAQHAYNSINHPFLNPNDMLGQIIVPIVVGVLVPFLKDVLADWREKRRLRRKK